MKRVAIVTLILIFALIFAAKPIKAQIEECSLNGVNVATDVTAEVPHSKVTWDFACSSASKYKGQMTKMIYTIPLTDIASLEVSDSLGSLKVLEGPEYSKVSTGSKQSTIGVIFRKGLLITNENTSYSLIVEFDSNSILSEGENNTFSIRPANVIADPKVTIITAGVTETTYSIATVNYELKMPKEVSVQTLPAKCSIESGNAYCKNINKSDFNALEIKLVKTSGINIVGKIKEIGTKVAPKTRNIVQTVTNKISSIFKAIK